MDEVMLNLDGKVPFDMGELIKKGFVDLEVDGNRVKLKSTEKLRDIDSFSMVNGMCSSVNGIYSDLGIMNECRVGDSLIRGYREGHGINKKAINIEHGGFEFIFRADSIASAPGSDTFFINSAERLNGDGSRVTASIGKDGLDNMKSMVTRGGVESSLLTILKKI